MTIKNKDWKTTILIFVMAAAVVLAIVSTVIYTMRGKSRSGGIEEKLRLGQRYLSELDYDKAITVFEDVIKIDDRNTEAYAGLGDAFTGKKEWTSAVKSYDNAVRTLAESSLDNGTEYTEERLLAAFSDGSVRPVSGVLTEELDKSYVLKINENRVNAIESGLAEIYSEDGGSEEMEEWLDETGHSDYVPRDKEIAAVFTQSGETSESKTDVDETVHPYSVVINELTDRYGTLRMAQAENNSQEADGLCYLDLIDFTGDGKDELMAVCKNEEEEHYTGYIYQETSGDAELLFEIDQIENNIEFEWDDIYVTYTSDTGYVIETGRSEDSGWEVTYYWYRDGAFSKVYHVKYEWNEESGEFENVENTVLVDLADDYFCYIVGCDRTSSAAGFLRFLPWLFLRHIEHSNRLIGWLIGRLTGRSIVFSGGIIFFLRYRLYTGIIEKRSNGVQCNADIGIFYRLKHFYNPRKHKTYPLSELWHIYADGLLLITCFRFLFSCHRLSFLRRNGLRPVSFFCVFGH